MTLPRERPPYLRLVWSQKEVRRSPSGTRPRVNLALAIERHLTGQDGLSDEEFVVLHATGRPVAAAGPR
jgi:hypothetical protein